MKLFWSCKNARMCAFIEVTTKKNVLGNFFHKKNAHKYNYILYCTYNVLYMTKTDAYVSYWSRECAYAEEKDEFLICVCVMKTSQKWLIISTIVSHNRLLIFFSVSSLILFFRVFKK